MESENEMVPYCPSKNTEAKKSKTRTKRKMSENIESVKVYRRKLTTPPDVEVPQPFKQQRKPACLNIRTSPNGLYNLIRELSDVQKDSVKAIGFGSLLSLRMSKCPIGLSRHLLTKFDVRRCALNLSNGETLIIDEEDIQCVLNLPRGDVEITECIGKSSDDGPEFLQVLRAWRRRWVGSENRGAPAIHSMPERILANTEANDDFKRDFVVYVVSSFLWTTQNSQCRFKILKSLLDVDRIKDLNWCRFTLNGLLDSVRKWQANEASYFHGPLTFLLLCYLDRVVDYTVSRNYKRLFPILSCWDDKMVYERIRNKEGLGGYDLGRVVDRISLPANFIIVDEPEEPVEPNEHEEHVEPNEPEEPPSFNSSAGAAWKKMADAVLQFSRGAEALADAALNLKKCTTVYKPPTDFSNVESCMQPLIDVMAESETVRKMFQYCFEKVTNPSPQHEPPQSPLSESLQSPLPKPHQSPLPKPHETPLTEQS